MAWYPGQRGGSAVADVLFGDANPSGRLPVTFYKGSEPLPAFDDYDMTGRTYRYFRGEPLYAFGHGLSYTQFRYSRLRVDRDRVERDGRLRVTARVTNSGRRAGEEVVQLYVRGVNVPQLRAVRELRGIQRVALRPGETREVEFELVPANDLRYYDEQRRDYAVAPGRYEVELGASSADIRAARRFRVR
jgi:beta-glucosidase